MGKNHRVRKETCSKCDNPRMRTHTLCTEHHRLHMADFREKVRLDTFTHYSNGTFVCAICGSNNTLEIDHIHGGGRQERKDLKLPAGWHFYQYLRYKGFPEGYRVLCKGCNAMAHYMTDKEIKQHYLDAAERIQNASDKHTNNTEVEQTINGDTISI